MTGARSFLRRHAPLLILLAGIIWIVAIALMIHADPVPSGGGPA